MRPWRCSYSSFSHGVSLGTLYRRMRPGLPAITVIQDTAGAWPCLPYGGLLSGVGDAGGRIMTGILLMLLPRAEHCFLTDNQINGLHAPFSQMG